MNCTHCGTLLPPGAMFCGECGRSVAGTAGRAPSQAGLRPSSVSSSAGATALAPARWVEDPVTERPLANDDAEAVDAAAEVGVGQARCDQCGTMMARDDIFCPECGFVSRSITRAFNTSDFTDETRQLDFTPGAILVDVPGTERSLPEPPVERSLEAHPEPEPRTESEPEPIAESWHELDPEPEPEPDFEIEPVQPESEVEPDPAPRLISPPTRFAPLPSAGSAPIPGALRAPRTAPAPPSRPLQSFRPDEIDEDIEATRIVNRMSGNRFVLQFSTGESFTVHGSGLIGRNPQPEPGEFFDHLVRLLDTGKSVSKTHLEFGQEQGAFWVKDRHSGNGTVIREPEITARRAEADRRYRVVRGTRIDIGEQFFVIS